MPFYQFLNEKTGELKDIFFHMNDEKRFIDNDGVEWIRQYNIPTTSIDTNINPDSANDFINKTKGKNYSIGQLWDLSAQASEKRAKVHGKDPVKEKATKAYEKKTNGKKHPHAND